MTVLDPVVCITREVVFCLTLPKTITLDFLGSWFTSNIWLLVKLRKENVQFKILVLGDTCKKVVLGWNIKGNNHSKYLNDLDSDFFWVFGC